MCYSLPFTYSIVQQFSGWVILLLYITPEHTLHGTVNDSILFITQPSLIFCLQILKEDLYVNVKFASTFLWKSIILLKVLFCLWVMLSSVFSLNLNCLFMSSMRIPSTCHPHLIFLYCFTFEVNNLFISWLWEWEN